MEKCTITYVETQYRCNSVEKFVDNLWNFLITEEEKLNELII